ncbi:phosphate ABC transporter substrate-binding protein [Massilia eurypsychrophila]|jgi:ABC-type phosphate transport system substrate-binding protein|uniref:Phosphate ABC transporter substrate-binding protein n=1 Tax=Massilia eurypsychrophila TaxID=1485217 RepID=A0A2G8TD22_9BURK|nr:phosphate ABC transporter substrate-binding protein [Massilia eurypsychrophila]PIL43930.1 phosphate ABC transporter substrate-binding protein [Massilia eurypsychrophila]
MKFSSLRHLLFPVMLAVLAPGANAGELVVIVSAKSPVAALRADQVADIFLGQVGRFPEGGEAVALDQGIGSAQRDEFYVKVAAKTPALVKAYWSKMIFTGRGQPPREAPNTAAIRKLVAENPSLIGYIERSALDASVKPVLMLH